MPDILQGLGVSAGIAVGRVLRLEPDDFAVAPVAIPRERIEGEIERFHQARARASHEILEVKGRVLEALGEPFAGMMEAQILILDDPSLVAETVRRIRTEGVTAGWALREVVEGYLRRFDTVSDGFFREKGGDLSDVHHRLQRLLRGEPEDTGVVPEGPVVVIARSLAPSDAMALARIGVMGLATDLGGRTSHTAILAQALSVPAVVGLREVTLRARSGDAVIVDGEAGRVVLRPGPPELAQAEERRAAWQVRESAMASARDLPVVTRDGVEVVIRANIEFVEEVEAALRYGAQGIGLYRSEFLFLARAPEFPTEEEHFLTYREIAEKVAPYPAIIRTLDLGGEKHFHQAHDRNEQNPVMGLRGVRMCLNRPDIFRPQVRGLLRAAASSEVRVLLPLVTTPEEVREVRVILAEEGESLRSQGIPCRVNVPLGIMVEVPAAAQTADILSREADFLSLGTNDLIQHALAIDRENESVADLYEPLHPAVLRMLAFVVRSGKEMGIPVSVCGEMAADPVLTGLLVGLGLRELSVQPRAIAAVREAVRDLDSAEALRFAEEALGLFTAKDIARGLRQQEEERKRAAQSP